jgi:hypothetical protein
MATRAAIIYLDGDNGQFTSTYNHYDGYPDNLGVALEKHYSDDFKAHKIAREGYITYMDPETGEIEQNNQQDPDVEQIYDEDTAVSQMNNLIQAYGADYAYIFSPALNKWVTIKNYGARATGDKLEQMMPELFGRGTNPENDMMEEKDYMTEWKAFLKEESFFRDNPVTIRWEKVRDNAYRMLRNEPMGAVEDYVDALERQIKFKPSDLDMMIDWEADDFLNDFREWETRKM